MIHTGSMDDEDDEKSSEEGVAISGAPEEGVSVQDSQEKTADASVDNSTNEEVEFHQPEIRAYSIQLAEVHYIPSEQLNNESEKPTPTNNATETMETEVEQRSTVTEPSMSIDDSSSQTATSSDKGFSFSPVDDNDGGILSTSGGSDWYRSLFQSMMKGVEEDLPDKKRKKS